VLRWRSFFFQAEDGIRDDLVTGVQTCALPICHHARHRRGINRRAGRRAGSPAGWRYAASVLGWPYRHGQRAGHCEYARDEWRRRSEERRVGKGRRNGGGEVELGYGRE